jgi:prolyl-tRNA editing enzyme YbaK/EbsC (Cys-tRNA(Pro) deacylase)
MTPALQTLRVKLDKAKQTSDWQLRPLVVEQLRYAACDALVLLHVYSALVSRGATSTPFLQSLTLSQDGSHVVDVENGAHYRPETAPVPSAPVVPAHGAPPTPDELALHLGTKHVMEYLASFGLQDRVVFLEPSPTAAIAAANLGIATKQIVNSLAFIVDGKAIIVLASGRSRVCMNKLSAVFGCPKKKVKMASRAQCLEIFGYLPGSFPPCAHRQPVPVYLDAYARSVSVLSTVPL